MPVTVIDAIGSSALLSLSIIVVLKAQEERFSFSLCSVFCKFSSVYTLSFFVYTMYIQRCITEEHSLTKHNYCA